MNQTRTVPQADFVRIVAGVNAQVRRDLAPAWQRYAVVYAGKLDAATAPATWRLVVRDQPDPRDAGSLGLHTTAGDGHVPTGQVFAQFSEQHGVPWSTVLSHEVLEMLCNEWVNTLVLHQDPAGPQLWFREVCDPVQGDHYEGPDGVTLSNFVLPEYYVDGADGPFDHMGRVRRPFEVRPGGYAAFVNVTPQGLAERQVYGAKYPEWRKGVAQRKTRCAAVAQNLCDASHDQKKR